MALSLREMVTGYNYMNNEISDPRTQDRFLIATPFPVIVIVGLYIYMVKHAGPSYMRHRPPYKLDRLIQVYNVVQIATSAWFFYKGWVLGWGTTYSWTCQPVDYSDDPIALEIIEVVYAVFLLKIVDLLDTVFFVLRKKTNQVSVLHVFHHAMMVIGTWVCMKYVPGGHGTFTGFINFFVHTIMYSYYLLTSIYPQQKNNIWWKKYITQMQIVQFLMIALHTGQLFFQPNCDYPIVMAYLITPFNMAMCLLFCNFYRKAYWKEGSERSIKKK